MNISFYTAAVGAQQQQSRLDVHGNNIANINNYGYRAEKPVFSSLMYQNITGINNAQLPRGVGSKMSAATTDFSNGGIQTTDRQYDFAISGNGFFGLLDPTTGEYCFTRDGSFMKSERLVQNADGELESKWYLSDGKGRMVLGTDGQAIEIKDSHADLSVGVFDFVNYDGMKHEGKNWLMPVTKNGQVRVGQGKALQGCLETSNADLATELAKVIEAQRSFSYALKMVQTSDELETTVNNLR